jgi:riboflavin biosynthesis pyrimidine reductase
MTGARETDGSDALPRIVRLDARAGAELDAEELFALYSPADRRVPTVRVNFVQSLDGASSVAGLSGGLGTPADKVVFDTLRALSDVVLVGAGTARAEGYGALTVGDELVDRRTAAGLSPHPAMALVSGRLQLDPAAALFRDAPHRPIVFTSATAPAEARARLAEVADVIDAGDHRVDAATVVRVLAERGLPQVLCEGGPSFFGDLIAGDLVDEFCLTMSPLLEGGSAPRIATSPGGSAAAGSVDEQSGNRPSTPPRGFELVHLLQGGSTLLTRWARA